jgi:hypothetical protein
MSTWDLPPVNITNTSTPNMPLGFAASAGIGAAGSILSSLIGNRGRRRAESRARDWNLSQWHRQNKYNHPLEQMQRLEAAGLNPNMIYGSSPGSAVGNAGSVHPGKAPEYKFSDPVAAGAALPVQQAHAANLSAQSIKNIADAKKVAIDAGISNENLLRLESTFGEYLEEAAGRAQEALFKGKSAKIKYEIENATKPSQIQKIVSEANFSQWHQERENLKLQMNRDGYIDGNSIGTIMKTMFGIDNDTPQWIKQSIIAVPAIARWAGPALMVYIKKWAKGPVKPK